MVAGGLRQLACVGFWRLGRNLLCLKCLPSIRLHFPFLFREEHDTVAGTR